MKIFSSVLIAILSALFAFPASPASRAGKTEFLLSGKEHHKWVKGMPLPTTLKEAGLLDDAVLVWSGIFLDGGSRSYLVKDSVGNYLAFCTNPGIQIKEDSRKVIRVEPHYFIGGLHYTHEDVQLVEPGSKCEQFLKTMAKVRTSITEDPANAKLLTSRPLSLVELASH